MTPNQAKYAELAKWREKCALKYTTKRQGKARLAAYVRRLRKYDKLGHDPRRIVWARAAIERHGIS
jgi:hypothetical protein